MSSEDTKYLHSTLKNGLAKNHKDPIWVKAFELFNESAERPLNMLCAPCYNKVLLFHLLKLTNV